MMGAAQPRWTVALWWAYLCCCWLGAAPCGAYIKVGRDGEIER